MEQVKILLSENKIDEAICVLTDLISKEPGNADYFYLLGKAYQKKSDFRSALNNYLQAIEIDPDSPAREAYNMTIEILNFYNKDMFNH